MPEMTLSTDLAVREVVYDQIPLNKAKAPNAQELKLIRQIDPYGINFPAFMSSNKQAARLSSGTQSEWESM